MLEPLHGFLGAIAVFLLAQLCTMVYWMGKVDTSLKYIKGDLDKALSEFKDTKTAINNRVDAEIKALWKRVDENRVEIASIKARSGVST